MADKLPRSFGKMTIEHFGRVMPFSGHLFVFRNRARDRLKVLWWDRDGLAVFYKRLERGSYQFPTDMSRSTNTASTPRCEIRAEELTLLLEGIELTRVKRLVAGCSRGC